MLPKPPAACAGLDLALVERTLAKHYGDIRRLTWAEPKLLEAAELERMGIIARAWGH